MKKSELLQAYEENILSTYTRFPLIFVKGKGMNLIDIHGRKYLDFFPGWGVNSIGHCHPKVQSAVRDQIKRLIHIPNTYYHLQQAKLAKEIIRLSFPGKVFFCNSGAEANEAAIKFARAYGQGQRFEIITMENSFHGRTLGALTATGQTKFQNGFAPLLEGFARVPFNDLSALKASLNPKTVAVMLELVQGEGGIHIAQPEYVQSIRQICDQKNILLILDEVQTGIGRTGEMFCFKHYGIQPDVMTLAKALGGGLPIGALIVKKEIADTFKPGMHASTFGGNPLVCKAALGVFKAIQDENMLNNVKKIGPYFLERLSQLQKRHPLISSIRGLGLMIGMELNREGQSLVQRCIDRGLLINCTQGNVLRLMPALNVTKKQIDKAIFILDQVLKEAD